VRGGWGGGEGLRPTNNTPPEEDTASAPENCIFFKNSILFG